MQTKFLVAARCGVCAFLFLFIFSVFVSAANQSTLNVTYSDAIAKVDGKYYYGRPGVTITASAQGGNITSLGYVYNRDDKQYSKYDKETDYNDKFYDNVASAKTSFTLKGNYCGWVKPDVNGSVKNSRYIVVDSIKPQVTMRKPTPAKTEGKAKYFDAPLTITLVVDEPHLDQSESSVWVDKKPVKASWNWVAGKTPPDGRYEANITINDADTGATEHTVEVQLVDYSTNLTSKTFSNIFLVDNAKPVVKVDWSPATADSVANDVSFFSGTRKATITVVEDNFSALGVNATITAKDAGGNAVQSPVAGQLQLHLKNEKNWTHKGNTHTATLTFSEDAIYAVRLSVADTFGNMSDSFSIPDFALDAEPPQNLALSYSKSAKDDVAGGITTSYYQTPPVITVSANDTTSGIDHFVLSSKPIGNGTAFPEQTASGQQIKIEGGTGASATFALPDTSFEGTLSLVAFDKRKNQSPLEETRRIVVDKTPPVGVITVPEASPVSGKQYYNKNVTVTLTVTEAYFDLQNTQVLLQKDNQAAQPVSVNWQNGVDNKHTADVVLNQDGEYKITLNATDFAGNIMPTQTTGVLVLDTEVPAITLEGVQDKRTDNAEIITLTLVVNDIHLDKVTPMLKGTVQDQDRSLGVVTLPFPSPTINGSVQTFRIDNIQQDGIYTLTCTVTDLAGNTQTQIINAEKARPSVSFSVNRNGSGYQLSDITAKIVEARYVKSVPSDLVLTEYNNSRLDLEKSQVKMNGQLLTRDKDYTVLAQSDEDGGWNTYTYTLPRALFWADETPIDREFTFSFASVDENENVAFSDTRNARLSFVIDNTPPMLLIPGLVENTSYGRDETQLSFIPMDDGGDLFSVQIDSDVVGEIARWDKGELTAEMTDFDDLKFTLPDGKNQTITITIADSSCSLDAEGNRDEEGNTQTFVFSGISVNERKRFPLVPVLIGSVVLLLSVGLLIFVQHRKKAQQGEYQEVAP